MTNRVAKKAIRDYFKNTKDEDIWWLSDLEVLPKIILAMDKFASEFVIYVDSEDEDSRNEQLWAIHEGLA